MQLLVNFGLLTEQGANSEKPCRSVIRPEDWRSSCKPEKLLVQGTARFNSEYYSGLVSKTKYLVYTKVKNKSNLK